MRLRAGGWRMTVVCVGAAAACLAQSGAQNTQTSAELTQKDTPVTFSTAVNLVLVPVVVRDAQGKAIGTLQKDDFQLFDKGKPVPIVKFSVEKAEAPPILPDSSIETDKDGNAQARPSSAAAGQPIAAHFIMWLFDDVHLSFDDLARTREAAKKVLKDSFEPGSRAAIYTTSNHTSLDFTDDRDKLNATLNEIKPWPTIPTNGVPDCPDVSYFEADAIINNNDQQALQAVQADYLACQPAVIPPGTTPSPQATAAIQAAIATPIRMAVLRELEIGSQDTRNALLVLKGLIRRMSAMPGSRTIVMVSPGFYLVTDHRTDESDLINLAVRNNVVISSLDARGLYTFIPGGNADTPGPRVDGQFATIKMQFEKQNALANQDVLEELAQDWKKSLSREADVCQEKAREENQD